MQGITKRFLLSFFAFFISLLFVSAHADDAFFERADVKKFVDDVVAKEHFQRQEVINILKEAKFQPTIIASMDRPYEKKNWDVYQSLFLTSERLNAGLLFWEKNKEALDRAQREYGVSPDIIVAIIGVETLYGKHQGNYRVLDALYTLAFFYPKRAEFFTKELKEFLLLCREHRVPVTEYYGSYAGAMGKPQFMPSSYRFYAKNFSGSVRTDLMNNDYDVIASVANYFRKHGWQHGQDVAMPAQIRGSRFKSLAVNTKVPDYPIQRLLLAGVRPYAAPAYPQTQAGLIELLTDNGKEYWLAYPNFYVITHYNTSPQYALVVHLFAEQLRKSMASHAMNHHA